MQDVKSTWRGRMYKRAKDTVIREGTKAMDMPEEDGRETDRKNMQSLVRPSYQFPPVVEEEIVPEDIIIQSGCSDITVIE